MNMDINGFSSGQNSSQEAWGLSSVPIIFTEATEKCGILFTQGELPSTSSDNLPRELTFTSDGLVSVVSYSVLFIIAAIGNVTVFINLFRNRRRRSGVNMCIMHLSIADMIVTFIMLPQEVAWHVTVAWTAGDIACRIFMFFRVFGFYLSSFILVIISLDRYFVIRYPLNITGAERRGKIMLVAAWTLSAIASIPQVG